MRLVIDAQIMQTDDFYRGMGFYLTSVLEGLPSAIKAGKKTFNICALLNPRLAREQESAELLRQWFPDVKIISVPLEPKANHEQTFGEAADKNRHLLTSVLKDVTKGEKYLFFTPAQFAYDIYPVFPNDPLACKVLLFHDLIPYLYSQMYFDSYAIKPAIDYCERFSEVFAADLIVTNSQTTADDLMVHFGFDEARIKPIFGSGAARTGIKPQKPDIPNIEKTRYVFMPSGDDRRKNNVRAVEAFALAKNELKAQVKLIISSKFSDGTRQHLQSLSQDVVFAGNVSDPEYLWLMDHAECMLFPTEYEGLGMPMLEGVARNANIVCSAISVFEELGSEAFELCDPLSVSDMKEAIMRALDDQIDWEAKKRHYKPMLQKFSWAKTAALFVDAMTAAYQAHTPIRKKKLAIHAPSPDSYSAVGKYAFEVHAELSRYYDIDYYLDYGHTVFNPVRLNILRHAARVKSPVDFSPEGYDNILYNIGNSEFHINGIYNALRYPGVAIMHDCDLQGIFDYMKHHGYMPEERFDAEMVLTQAVNNPAGPCITSLVNNQRALVCHSSHAGDVLKKALRKDVPVVQLQHPGPAPVVQNTRQPGKVVVSFAGIISPDKGIGLIRDIASLDPGIEVRLFGFSALGHEVDISDLANVVIMKNLSDLEFQQCLRTSDILVNYRMRYHGETSRTTIEAMRFGVPVVVKDIGWYGELPDDTVVKVQDTDDLTARVRHLIGDAGERRQIGDAAYAYAREAFAIRAYIQKIKHALEA